MFARLIAGTMLLIGMSAWPAAAQVAVGPNVNMGGGPASFTPPSTIIGDPFLQRQNEPSLAVSSRNPCHILAGANDYRFVDVEEAAGETGDAWLGVFKSFDCGATWTSTLLPGYRLDASLNGKSSPLRGLQAAADPTIRAGTSGVFYYSGIAFDRGAPAAGKAFIARFIDTNNKDGGDPIQYVDTIALDKNTDGQFIDKPWIATDIPRGTATCELNGQVVPAANVYVVYTTFVNRESQLSNLMFSRSRDCGKNGPASQILSGTIPRNQGAVVAVDPDTGVVYVAWREFALGSEPNGQHAIHIVRSTDFGRTFSAPTKIAPNGYQLEPFDQASSPLTFRTNAYPTMTIVPPESEGRPAGQPGRIYVAWSARGFGVTRPSDARILITSSIGGDNWTAPKPADDYADSGHQIMPALAFSGGKLGLAYYDLRDDRAGAFEDLVVEYGLAAYQDCVSANPGMAFSQIFICMLSSPSGLTRRHTLDMRAAMVDAQCLADGTCGFSSTSVLGESSKVSRYRTGRGSADGPLVQLQYNRPNLPIFSRGRFPFIGDYIDIQGQVFLPAESGGWAWNTGKSANRPAPIFHVAWSDNRNVGTPRDTNWENYTPAVLGPSAVMCTPGQVGVRNQDVYTSQLRPALIVSSPQNSKRIAGLQRSFAVIVRNTTGEERDYVVRAHPTPGVIASFDQFSGFGALDGGGLPIPPLEEIVLRIPSRSSSSRTLFVSLEVAPADPEDAPDVLVPVTVEEIAGGSLTGTSDMIFLNPDFENPDFENPDFENAELHNPDFENLDFENPDFENPDFENFTLTANSSIRNPDFENPDFENPDFENPDFENPDFENPDFENPDFENPDFENPDFENPDFENPDFENPDFENGTFEVADSTWPVRNNGNTTSAFKANVFVNDPMPGVSYQLVVRKIYTSPAPVCAVDNTPALTAQSVPLVNIIGPDVQANPFDRSFNDPSRDNATFTLAPNERGLITLRAYCAAGASCTRGLLESLQGNIALGVVAQAANCTRCAEGTCNDDDLVGSFSQCSIDSGPPKDIYDPVPPSIEVVDPTISTPELEIVADDTPAYFVETVSFTIRASDNVGIANVSCLSAGPVVTQTGATGDAYVFSGIFPLGTTRVTCTANDVNADPAPNAASVDLLVTVRDVTPPILTLIGSPNVTIEKGSVYTDAGATASDIVSGAIVPTVTGAVNTNEPGVYILTFTARDAAGNTTTTMRTVTVVRSNPLGLTAQADPNELWPPNKAMRLVKVKGVVTNAAVAVVTFSVKDEYGLIQPSGSAAVAANGSYSFDVTLQASRNGSDKDGRVYEISVTVVEAGLSTTVKTLVVVTHDQGKK